MFTQERYAELKAQSSARHFVFGSLGAAGALGIGRRAGGTTGPGQTREKASMIDDVGPRVKDFGKSRAIYTAALGALGVPGPRPNYGPDDCAAFLFDPDGINVEAVCRIKDD